MRKAVFSFALAALGSVMSAQAVVISWASETVLPGAASARLVYIDGGELPVYATGGVLQNTSPSADLATASGGAIDGVFLYEQTTTDNTLRDSGTYYVVLFNSDVSQYKVSTASLAWNSPDIGQNEMDAPTTFYASFTGDWTPVPEPSTAMLLCIGTAAALLRRRKRV